MSPAAVVATRGLTKRYGHVTAVADLGLEVRKGEIYAFLGRNGAGKTTTIRMILGLIRPAAGEVRVFGRPVGPAQPGWLRPVSYTHLRAHETVLDLVCRLLLEKKK